MLYNIKLCDADDIDKVKHFINEHWKKNHVLAISQTLIDFQHYEAHINKYNFIIAINILTKEVDGLIGFIPTSHYDITLDGEKDCWGAIWKIREDIENEEIKTLGLYLFEHFGEITSFKTFGAIGISEIAKKLYTALRYKTNVLNHFYIINPAIKEFKIAQINQIESAHISTNKSVSIKSVSDLRDIVKLECHYSPKKSILYFINRYQNHPIYKYKFWGIYKNEKLQTIIVIRVLAINGSKALRIIDLLGDYENLPNIYNEIQMFLKAENAEYIDCVNFGIREKIFVNAGFIKLQLDGGTIIPNYFEPFERKNIKIEFSYKSKKPYMVFKGDSDQDRPNIIKY